METTTKNLTLGIIILFLMINYSVGFSQKTNRIISAKEICGSNRIGIPNEEGSEKVGLNNCVTANTKPCEFPTIRDSFLINSSTPIKYFTLLYSTNMSLQ